MGVLFVLRSTWHKWFCFSGLKLRETPQPTVLLARGVVSFITSVLVLCSLFFVLCCLLFAVTCAVGINGHQLTLLCWSFSDSVSADLSQPGNVISVKCGSVEGSLYLDRLLGGQPGREGGTKCIYYPSKRKWVSPVEFEGLGGKSKSGKWKQSIKTGSNIAIGSHLSSLGFDTTRPQSPSLSQPSSSAPNPSLIVSPLLILVKAFRLRGDVSTLKKAVTACFDSSSLIEAHKLLWDFCCDSLKELGLVYHSRRSTDKHDAFEATLVDILSVIDKLDEADSIPPIFCEASQLIKISSLEPDPVSKRLDTNYKAITGLVEKVDNISLPLNNTKKALDQVVISLQDQLANLSSSVSSFSKSISDELRDPSSCSKSSPSSSATDPASNRSVRRVSEDRSSNVVLFGVPELPLSETKSFIDEVACHLIGRTVSIKDAYHIGHRKQSHDGIQSPDESSRPRSLLIKLMNDRRLLLASRFSLKNFEKAKLFLREDLPPHARQSSNRKASTDSQRDSHEEATPGIPQTDAIGTVTPSVSNEGASL